jgi:hypothetical protein
LPIGLILGGHHDAADGRGFADVAAASGLKDAAKLDEPRNPITANRISGATGLIPTLAGSELFAA